MISRNHIIYRNDRNNHGVGVLIGINENLKSLEIDLETEKFESITAQLFKNNEKYIQLVNIIVISM